eukprot:scaffold7.g3597.t1
MGDRPGSSSEDSGKALEEVLLNERVLSGRANAAEDEDLKLAMILQEQERAFLALAGGFAGARAGADAAAAENYNPRALASSASPPHAAAPRGAGAGGARAAGEGPEEAAEQGAAQQQEQGEQAAAGEAALTDEELAAALQAEEDAAFQARLLALAGVGGGFGPAGGEEEGEAGEEEEGYLSEDGVDPDEMTYEELTALGEAVGTVSRGLPPAVVAALPLARYAALRAGRAGAGAGAAGGQEGRDEEEQCPVCRVELGADDELRLLPCGHYYHPECIGEWLRHNKVCCVCNKEVAPVDGQQQQAQQQQSTGAAPERAPLGERGRQ